MAARKWTDEQKAAQSAKIHKWQPWQHSTGAKTPEGKAISSMNAHRGYFRRRARFGEWLLWAKNHHNQITPEIIAEAVRRADKLNLLTNDGLKKYTQHSQFFDDIASANAIAAMAEPAQEIIELCHVIRVLKATALIIRGF